MNTTQELTMLPEESSIQAPPWWEDDCVPRYQFRPYCPAEIENAARGARQSGLTCILLDPGNVQLVDGMVFLVPELDAQGRALQWHACLFPPLPSEARP